MSQHLKWHPLGVLTFLALALLGCDKPGADAEAKRAKQEEEDQKLTETAMANGNRLIDAYWPAVPRRRAFVWLARPREVKANSLRIAPISLPNPRDGAAVVLSITNESDGELPFPFAWRATVEDPYNGSTTWGEPNKQMLEQSAPSLKKNTTTAFRTTGPIKPGQTVDIVVDLEVPATRYPSTWLTILAFRADLVTDCDCLVVATSSTVFYQYQVVSP